MSRDPSSNPAAAAISAGRAWVIAQSLFLIALGIAAPLWPGQWPRAASISIGSAAFLYAAWTGISAVFRLGRNRTTFPAARPDSTLVNTGINARIRHPLYSAMMAMGLGWACFWSSGSALGLALAFIVFLHAKARFEEALLCVRFEDYPAYAARVPRYVPRWTGSRR
jgi:protein-S-isoprenylcysteine O-methyltransferase Ste14